MNMNTTTTSTASPSLHDQYSTNPPKALTVILSVACGIVATCILFTIVLLLLRHRSSEQEFRQGQHPHRASLASKSKSHVGDGSTSALYSQDHEAAMYLPILHSVSPSLQSKAKTKTTTRTHAPGDRTGSGGSKGCAPSLEYPKAVHLGSSRTDTMMSPQALSHIV